MLILKEFILIAQLYFRPFVGHPLFVDQRLCLGIHLYDVLCDVNK